MSLTVETPQPVTGQPGVLHEYFERSVRRWPNAIAVEVPPAPGRPERRMMSYRELARRSDRVAAAVADSLDDAGIAAILLPRTTERPYVAQLGVLKAGAAHLCIDPASPDEQVRHLLSDADPGVVLTDRSGSERVRRLGYLGPVVRLDRPRGLLTPPDGTPDARLTRAPERTAYVIYTSGTTGAPKGVLIAHRSAANLIASDLVEFGLGPGDRVAQGSSTSYDSSVEEIWMALSSGATVVVMDDATARLGPDLIGWLRDERITVLCPPPTLLRATGCDDPQRELPDLRLLYVGGEVLPEDVAQRWAPGRRMVNGYGPTECTVTCLRSDVVPGERIAIGHPVPGTRAWVLDGDLEPVPDGVPGELCMTGIGLAVGYHNQPELTAARFCSHPMLGRLYRTGDLVHVEADGTVVYHGRLDSQVKLRGYRIELEAVEACLMRCDGVREAACGVQGDGPAQALAAHIVPTDPGRPPSFGTLRAALQQRLPAHMVPSLFGLLDQLPRSAGGKVSRGDLPTILARSTARRARVTAPADPTQQAIAEAVQAVLPAGTVVSIDDDFFEDLGGTSLQAAMLISRLRTVTAIDSITVRDLYETRTVEALARRARADAPPPTAHIAPATDLPGGDQGSGSAATRVTIAQVAWLVLELLIGAPLAYLAVFRVLPVLSDWLGLVPLLIAAPLLVTLAGVAWTPISIALVVLAKKALIGRYTPMRASVWSSAFVRVWMMQHLVRLIPWRTIGGTEYQCMALRALGARIGSRVHIARGVDLSRGGWDLLDIGDDVTISQDASIRLVQLEHGQVVVGPVTLDDGATLDVRAGVGPGSRLGTRSWLSALSSLPAGAAVPADQTWDGVPARPAGPAPEPPVLATGTTPLPPRLHGIAMIMSRSLLSTALALPSTLVAIAAVTMYHLSYGDVLTVLAHPLSHLGALGSAAALVCLLLIGTVALQAVAARALGPIREGVIARWGLGYLRVWLKTGLVSSAGTWLSGGLYWPVWLRWAGMRVGPGCEISTIIDVVPELVDVSADVFFADGIYLGGPRIHQGTVTLAAVRLERDTFVGNHAVIPGGQRLPSGILIGIATVADDSVVQAGTSWFGHPAFELPHREIVDCDRSLTHQPSPIRVADRLFWEWLRFALPVVPMAALVAWVSGLSAAGRALPSAAVYGVGAALVTLGCAVGLCMVVLAMKWALLGRVQPGIHALWSCWCSRWDFLYVAWGVIASGVLGSVEGTLLLPMYLRRMGMRIGKRVVLAPGFAQVVDPDMIEISDGATVNAMFQAHTFEDRVLKIGHIRVGARSTLAEATVPLYGADIGARAYVAPHSVVMKHEHLQPGRRYEGVPTGEERRLGSDERARSGGVSRSGGAARHQVGLEDD